MALLFGPSESDLEHLRSTVRALGTTSVPGLSAALSWRERKTEKLLAHELARPTTSLVYDPARRTVRWVLPAPVAPPIAPAPRETPVAPPPTTPRAPLAPAPTYTPGGLRVRCPHCQVSLLSTGSNGLLVCPQCGRLSSARSAAVAAAAPPPGPSTSRPAPVAAASSPAAPSPSGSGASERRSQEMFAAWVTNQPIPCPKCRTPLRHRGVSVYGCPSCGQQVRFSLPGSSLATPPAVTASAGPAR